MKAAVIFSFIVMMCWGCTKDFTRLNTDPTQFTKATPEAGILAAVKNLNTQMANHNTSKYWDLGHLLCQQSNRYDVTDAGLWQTMYQGVLGNLQQIELNYGNDSAFNNRVQIARIVKAYAYSILAGNYGPVPLTQANDPEHLSAIGFDGEDAVYSYVLTTLKDAAGKIKPAGDKMAYDVIYNGNLQNWVKFANTLRLKIALQCMKNLGSAATDHIREVMSSEAATISNEMETAKMSFENVNGNENPYFVKYIKGNGYFPYNPTATGQAPKLSEYMLTLFRSYSDPRLSVYYDTVPLANRFLLTDTLTSDLDDSLRVVTYPVPYLGQPKAGTKLAGWTNLAGLADVVGGADIKAYSNANPIIFQPNRPFIMLSFSESLFLKAEAAKLGYGWAMAPEQYYYAGIDANFAYWGINSALRDAYKARDGIKWGTRGKGFNNYLSLVNTDIPQDDNYKIWTQRWLNYFPDGGFDCWALERRTWVFNLPPHTNPGGNATYSPNPTYSDIPGRMSYPVSVVNLNPVGYQSALQALGTARVDDYDIYQELHFAKHREIPDWASANATYDYAFLRKWYGTTIQSLDAAAAANGFRYSVSLTYRP
ncbi:SusD/RagB family nutrient-binding outer membrane lipoprotein [Chitinophaga sp. RAB17]|uniref:SusD/RagB family nutrient-binding outer membrane lipoprotein n=1 Tax=Chitinophaga sp. RAB17 TaxID=3233049 RepID=UPI003F8FE35D